MPRHDAQCSACGHIFRDLHKTAWDDDCPECSQPSLVILWNAPSRPAGISPEERTVVWENPTTGEVRYPGRADAPLPSRYASQGFQRREFTSLREVDQWSKRHNVINERANYNSGNDGF